MPDTPHLAAEPAQVDEPCAPTVGTQRWTATLFRFPVVVTRDSAKRWQLVAVMAGEPAHPVVDGLRASKFTTVRSWHASRSTKVSRLSSGVALASEASVWGCSLDGKPTEPSASATTGGGDGEGVVGEGGEAVVYGHFLSRMSRAF